MKAPKGTAKIAKARHFSLLKPVLLSVIVGTVLRNAAGETKRSKPVAKLTAAKPAASPGQKNAIQRLLARLDRFQQGRRGPAFAYAVIKKYGDDEGGYQGALITYYGFLSLFPLLIVATSVIDLLTRHNDQLRDKLLHSINDYFPAIGGDLQSSIHGSSKTGVALVIGLLITLWGSKGVADAVRSALNHVWEVPRQKRPGFPKGPLKSLGLIIGAGIGLALATVISGYTVAVSHSVWFRFLPAAVSLVILFGVFLFVFRVASSAKHSLAELMPGAAVVAVGLFILQTVGTSLVKNQLRNTEGLYGQFGLVLALLFWLYLQAQVFLYAAEINTVKALKLWPRSLTQDPLTEADRQAFALYAKRETRKDPEEVNVEFES